MSIKIPRGLWFAGAYLLCLILYWPVLSGTPIWDDYSFWFSDPVFRSDISYWSIFRDFGWPVSVSVQKFLLGLWGENFIFYHSFNLFLHFLNSYLVYHLGRRLRIRWPFLFFFLFLIHPVAVISTAWMIQVKTLLSFFFGLTSFFAFLKGEKNKKWLLLSIILFALSIGSKSASLTLPFVMALVHFKNYRFRKSWYLIPFFILSFYGMHRILTSSVTLEGSVKASAMTNIKEGPKVPKVAVESPADPLPEPPAEVTPQVISKTPQTLKVLRLTDLNPGLVVQTMNYYFWQPLLPVENSPIKGLNFEKVGPTEFLHIFFLLLLTGLFWKDAGIYYLLSAHILLLPFLGIIPAPFMNVTWVSDQHLYLVLPALLGFWFRVLGKFDWKYRIVIPIVLSILFVVKTWETIPIYKDQIAFYEKSLQYNPANVAIAFNLAHAYIIKGDLQKTLDVLSMTYQLADQEPLMKKNIFWPHFFDLYLQLHGGKSQ